MSERSFLFCMFEKMLCIAFTFWIFSLGISLDYLLAFVAILPKQTLEQGALSLNT